MLVQGAVGRMLENIQAQWGRVGNIRKEIHTVRRWWQKDLSQGMWPKSADWLHLRYRM